MVSNMRARGTSAAKPLRLKAARLEREGDLAAAFDVYGEAAALSPNDPELLAALADLASRLEMHEEAVRLWSRLTLADPGDAAAALGHARALTAAGRFSDAIEVLKAALSLHPEEPRLWTALGLALTYAGRAQEALTFFDEAVRLGPDLPGGRYNRGLALCDLGRLAEAEADFEAAARAARRPAERATIEFSLATLALARSDLERGWRLYEQRLSPDWPASVSFQAPGRRLGPDDDIAGRSLLVLAEQGLGDEILFASLVPDLLEAVGETGRLVLAVEPRLVTLMQRSFPGAEVRPHATRKIAGRAQRTVSGEIGGRIDFWTPLASLARRRRPRLEDFPRAAYLHAAPARVAHWRRWLGDPPAVGLSWRSGKLAAERRRFYPALQDWTSLLRSPGAQFVCLQYGECAEDLERLTQLSGVEIRVPPGLDIRNDIDELAALCTALDAVVSVQNATGMLAAACGAPTLFVAAAGSWTHLGETRPPWFADAQLCAGEWPVAIAAATDELTRRLVA